MKRGGLIIAVTKKQSKEKPDSLLDIIFDGSLLLKGMGATLELIGALLLILIPGRTANHYTQIITEKEFVERHASIGHAINSTSQSLFFVDHTFIILYLLTHAAIKFVIVISLWKRWTWSYPFSFIALGGMILYQILEMFHRFTIGMLLLTIFDVFVYWLIWLEYKKTKVRLAQTTRSQS